MAARVGRFAAAGYRRRPYDRVAAEVDALGSDSAPGGLQAPSATRRIFMGYAAYALLVEPLLSILRLTGVFNSSVLIQYVNVIVATCLVASHRRVRLLRTHYQALLVLVAVQASVLGLLAFPDIPWRDYFSHGAQLGIAFIMLGTGAIVGSALSKQFWHRLAMFSLAGGVAALALTLAQHSAGNVARYELPAYGFLIAWSKGLADRHVGLVLAAGALIALSAKRGVMVAAVGALGVALAFAWQQGASPRSASRRAVRGLAVSATVVMLFVLLTPAGESLKPPEVIARTVELSRERIDFTLEQLAGGKTDINVVSSGRAAEAEAALDTLDPITVLTGRGAGAQVELPHAQEQVQFLHLSPLSLTMVYGLPFALATYGFIALQIVRGLRGREDDPLSRMLAIYASAALVHSFFAYSLFIDLFLFFSVGCLHERYGHHREGV